MAERRDGGGGPSTRVALVTGANRGIGLAIAEGLAERGLHVLLSARDPAAAARAAAPLRARGLTVSPVALDVTAQGSVDALAQQVRRDLGRLDALVNNAGAYYDTEQDLLGADMGIVQAALETNLLGAWRACQAFVPLMRRQRYGRVVNVSSGAGAFNEAGTGTPAYRVSKAALNMLTVTLAAELAGEPILVNAACPGWVRTDMGGAGAPRSPEQGADTPIWLATLPAGGPSGGFFRDRRRIAW
jgi:NAD(P)-dependent dehydrogenase (short-subunit alcohol dehydrogenase family)